MHSVARTPRPLGVHVTEYKFPTRGVQGQWRQTLTPTPSSASEPDRHTVCRGRTGHELKSYKPYVPRETGIRRHAPPGISGVRATEYQFPFRGSYLRTQVSLSWRDELQRHGPRGIAGDCVAQRKFRRGNLCTGARLPSNETGSTKDPLMYEE